MIQIPVIVVTGLFVVAAALDPTGAVAQAPFDINVYISQAADPIRAVAGWA